MPRWNLVTQSRDINKRKDTKSCYEIKRETPFVIEEIEKGKPKKKKKKIITNNLIKKRIRKKKKNKKKKKKKINK